MQKTNNSPNTTQIGLTNQSVFGLKCSMNDLCLYTPYKYNINENVTITFWEFAQRLNKKINNIIDEDFDWNNILLAGGLISGLLEKKFDEKIYKKSDIDLFVYGKNKHVVIEKIVAIYDYFAKKLNNKFYAFIYNMSPIISIIIPGQCPIQIIGTQFEDPIKILESFDMTYCQVGFNGNQIIHTNEFVQAITSKITKITTRSVHAYRLVKAHQRGYSIQRPEYCYIKNIFHEYTSTFVLNKDSSIPSNTDKFYDINDLQNIIGELIINPIVIKNLTKNYVPSKIQSFNDTRMLKDELDKIGTSYAGEKKYIFINDCDNFTKYHGDGSYTIPRFVEEFNNPEEIVATDLYHKNIRHCLPFQRKLF